MYPNSTTILRFILVSVICLMVSIQTAVCATTYTVTNTTDDVFSPQNGSLRWAINQALAGSGGDIIAFNIPGGGQQTISINGSLPVINKTVTIDGTTQSGYVLNNPSIIIDGVTNNLIAFLIRGGFSPSNVVVKGLHIKRFELSFKVYSYNGQTFTGPLIQNNVITQEVGLTNIELGISGFSTPIPFTKIQGNLIGTDISGTKYAGGGWGIYIAGGVTNTLIGGSNAGEANTIYSPSSDVYNQSSTYVKVSRNVILTPCNGSGIVTSAKPNPVITSVTIPGTISGTAQANDVIEIFGSDGSENALQYITTVSANGSGNWSTSVGSIGYSYVVATATDFTGKNAPNLENTSPLSTDFLPPNSSIAPTGISASSTNFCQGGSSTLSVSGGTLGKGASWKWYSGSCGGTFIGTGASITVSPASTTTYFVRAEGTCNTTSCAQVTITVNQPSVIPTGATATQAVICSGQSTTLNVTGGTLGTGASWKWYSDSCGGTFAGTGTSINVFPTTATTYFVRSEGTCNTTSCAQVSVTVNPLPVITVDPANPSVCPWSGSVTLTASGASSYSWSPSNTLDTAVGSTVIASPSTATTYNVTGTDANACVSSGSVLVSINNSIVNAGANAAICKGSSIILGGNPTAVECGNTSLIYSWSPEEGLSSMNVSNPGASPDTTTTYTVQVTKGDGVFYTGSVTITVNDLPLVSASAANANICQGQSTQLNATGSGATYSWLPVAGLSDAGAASTFAQPNSSVNYVVTATDGNSCSSQAAVTVNVAPAINLSLSGDVTIPKGDNAVLQATSNALNYQWTPSTGLNSPNSAITNASPSTTTTYNLVASDNASCSASGAVTVTVVNPPDAHFTYSFPGLTVSFTPAETGSVTYLWTFHDGTTSTGSTPNYTYSQSGKYRVCLKVTNTYGSATYCNDINVLSPKSICCGGGPN